MKKVFGQVQAEEEIAIHEDPDHGNMDQNNPQGGEPEVNKINEFQAQNGKVNVDFNEIPQHQ